MSRRALSILGTRGIPNRHGGFESCAERLAPWLVERGWEVTVYCQEPWGHPARRSQWRGVTLEHVPARLAGSTGSVLFDVQSAWHASRSGDLLLTLGYNTAVIFPWHMVRRRRHVVNMDGLEWRRGKWPAPVKAWFYANSWIAGVCADRLIADHPEIAAMLARRGLAERTVMVPYGADAAADASPAPLARLGLAPDGYALVIARPEPENSVLEIVRAWSRRRRPVELVVVGHFDRAKRYHRAVHDAAGDTVRFVGAIYDGATIQALRAHTRLYVHGHTVGGTNPSLVEALGAGSPVLAHDNRFNRWVAGPAQHYFADESLCAAQFDALLDNYQALRAMRTAAMARHAEAFTWDHVLPSYEAVLLEAIRSRG